MKLSDALIKLDDSREIRSKIDRMHTNFKNAQRNSAPYSLNYIVKDTLKNYDINGIKNIITYEKNIISVVKNNLKESKAILKKYNGDDGLKYWVDELIKSWKKELSASENKIKLFEYIIKICNSKPKSIGELDYEDQTIIIYDNKGNVAYKGIYDYCDFIDNNFEKNTYYLKKIMLYIIPNERNFQKNAWEIDFVENGIKFAYKVIS